MKRYSYQPTVVLERLLKRTGNVFRNHTSLSDRLNLSTRFHLVTRKSKKGRGSIVSQPSNPHVAPSLRIATRRNPALRPYESHILHTLKSQANDCMYLLDNSGSWPAHRVRKHVHLHPSRLRSDTGALCSDRSLDLHTKPQVRGRHGLDRLGDAAFFPMCTISEAEPQLRIQTDDRIRKLGADGARPS